MRRREKVAYNIFYAVRLCVFVCVCCTHSGTLSTGRAGADRRRMPPARCRVVALLRKTAAARVCAARPARIISRARQTTAAALVWSPNINRIIILLYIGAFSLSLTLAIAFIILLHITSYGVRICPVIIIIVH